MAIRITTASISPLCVAALLLIIGGPRRTAAADIPEPVRRALESNARLLSPITVGWGRTRTSDLPRSKALSLLPGELSSLFLPQQWRLMWDNGRFHIHSVCQSVQLNAQPGGRITELTEAPLFQTEADVTFDGQKRYACTKGDLEGSPTILIIDRPSNLMIHGRNVMFLNAEFIYQVGFHLPERAEDYEAKRPAKSLPLYLVEEGARVIEVGREEIAGASCTVLVLRSPTAENRFVLDPAKGYAVRRRIEKTPSGELSVRADCSDFTQLPGSGLWMPRTVEVEWHTWPQVLAKPVKEAVVRETYRVSELENKPIPPEQFVVKCNAPGAIVADSSLEGEKDPNGRVNYRVPADPNQLDEVVKAAAAGKNYDPTIVLFRRKLILANVLLILIVIGVVWWRYVRKPR